MTVPGMGNKDVAVVGHGSSCSGVNEGYRGLTLVVLQTFPGGPGKAAPYSYVRGYDRCLLFRC